MEDFNQYFQNLITTNKVVLFAKGTQERPACGFSARTIEILESYSIDFAVDNVMDSFGKKEALKTFSDWPTMPQLYVNGELVGGADIVYEMYKSGDLDKVLA